MADVDIKEYVKERYKLILKAYGEHSEYVAGFRACMQIVERNEGCEMKPYEATEAAYKNGYKQGVKDFAEMVKKYQVMLFNEIYSSKGFAKAIDKLAKELERAK